MIQYPPGVKVRHSGSVTAGVRPGEHRVVATKGGEVIHDETFAVARSQTVQVNIYQKPPQPSPGGFVPLFNGKDLSGWKTHSNEPGSWHVVGGVLVGTGTERYLFSERGDYRDFHLRVEAKITDHGNSGVHFRSAFGPKLPDGYEAQINLGTDPWETGSLLVLPWKQDTSILNHVMERLIQPDKWFTLEVLAQGARIIIKVDGNTVTDLNDQRYKTGHLALQAGRLNTEIVQFRKIEIKELPQPPAVVAPFDAAKAKAYQQDWAKHLGVPVEVENSVGMKLRFIPTGKFLMGSPDGEADRIAGREGPQHSVTIAKHFHIGVHEVTQQQYERVVGKNPSHFSADNKGGPNHPVDSVNHEDAVEFCRLFSKLPEEKATGRTYRLPTEAEWEYACRAGTTTAYSHGDDPQTLSEYAWYKFGDKNTQPVGLLKPNSWGLYDMHGNVFETCADQHDYGSGSERLASKLTISRGGSWYKSATDARSAYRGVNDPKLRHRDVGFRVVCEIDAKK